MRQFVFFFLFFFCSIKADIPKTLHFVHLENKPLTAAQEKNLLRWAKFHPDFRIKVWVDDPAWIKQNPRFSLEEIHQVFKDPFLDRLSGLDKVQYLRYVILKREGGVFVDQTVYCNQSLRALCEYPFFIGLSSEKRPLIGRKNFIAPHLIGSTPNHDVLDHCLESIRENYDQISQKIFPSDSDFTVYLYYYRWVKPVDDVIKTLEQKNLFEGQVFPIDYFNRIDQKKGRYAQDQNPLYWLKEESESLRYFDYQVKRLEKKISKITVLIYVFFFSLGLVWVYFLFIRKGKHQKTF